MWDGERLVQIEMADIGAECTRLRESNLRVHVRAVHVDEPTRRMHRVTDLTD